MVLVCIAEKRSFALSTINLKPSTMRVVTESIRSFFEGFASFYTLIYDEMKSW
ncbi:MAG: hypothetical protein J0L56_06790 [Chitinophagales bacterium]|nr:hypothetical protein [Chitinophagales bacterium]